jgi:SAM-dependent methyltransferase
MNIYDQDFRETIDAGSFASALEVVPTISSLISANGSVLDVGCGEGQWLRAFKDLGHTVKGIDSGVEARYLEDYEYIEHDISTSFPDPIEVDLWITLEVAEHLYADRADPFVDYLTSCGSLGLFSAAIPGQGGTHHVNEQWPAYWVEKFNARGYQVSGALRLEFWDNDNVENWYRQNMMLVWDGSDTSTDFGDPESDVSSLFRGRGVSPVPLVHPVLYRHKTGAA